MSILSDCLGMEGIDLIPLNQELEAHVLLRREKRPTDQQYQLFFEYLMLGFQIDSSK